MHVNHVNIVVANMERSLDFYVGLLGMRVTFETHLSGDWIEEVVGLAGVSARCVFCQPDGGGARFELLEYEAPSGFVLDLNSLANTHGLRHVALEVDDLDAWYTKLTTAGVEAISPPVTVPFRIVDGIQKRLCYLRDPDGAIIELCEHLTVRD
jgi:catechol 2,3-dioxygenase-like lactoylglutathione lyase family enzyme